MYISVNIFFQVNQAYFGKKAAKNLPNQYLRGFFEFSQLIRPSEALLLLLPKFQQMIQAT